MSPQPRHNISTYKALILMSKTRAEAAVTSQVGIECSCICSQARPLDYEIPDHQSDYSLVVR